jgi:hypothetical protein
MQDKGMYSTETCTISYCMHTRLHWQIWPLGCFKLTTFAPRFFPASFRNTTSTDHSRGIFRVPGRNKDQEPEACVPTQLLTAAPGLAAFATASGADDGLVESELPFSLLFVVM